MWLDTLENIVQIWQQIIPCCNNNGSLESYMHGSVVIREYRKLTHLRKKVWFLKTLPQSLMRNKRLCIPRGSCDSTQKFWVQPFFAWRKLYIQIYLCLLLRPIQLIESTIYQNYLRLLRERAGLHCFHNNRLDCQN